MKDQSRRLATPTRRTSGARFAVAQAKGRKLGRPTKLTAELQRRICIAVEAGNYLETAAELCGLGRSTLLRWLSLADGGDEQFRDFRDAVMAARAKAEAQAVAEIRKAGRKSWQANSWFLERSFPDHWGRKERPANTDPIRASFVEPEPESDAAGRLSDALRRDPNQIPAALDALTVLAAITSGTAPRPPFLTPLPGDADPLPEIGPGSTAYNTP